MAKNIELKARLRAVSHARKTARRLENRGSFTEHQVDTYFVCNAGRLKLRQRSGLASQLIAYQRADDSDAKASEYQILEVTDDGSCKSLLQAALGILCVVDKRREVYLHENVRIHLDDVAELGYFVEFEAVLTEDVDESVGHGQVDRLREAFAISSTDLIATSYSDMILNVLSQNGEG